MSGNATYQAPASLWRKIGNMSPPKILRETAVSLLCILLLCVIGQTDARNQQAIEPRLDQRGTPLAPRSVANFAKRYLRSIEYTNPYESPGGHGLDFIFLGESQSHHGEWRVVVVRASSSKPLLVWDSNSLTRDRYFSSSGLSSLDSDADGSDGYIVTWWGCVPHDCGDGRLGFALFSSRTNQTYVGHITTKDDGSYVVTYYPSSGMPAVYRNQLDRVMCTPGNGVSDRSKLPIKCPNR
jgi:hypothetical protein